MLGKLADDRILRPVAPLPDRPDESRYEIFHDVLGPEILDWRAAWERQVAERKRRKLVAAIAALAVLLAVMGGAVWLALDKKREADQQESIALAQGELARAQEFASASQASARGRPDRSGQAGAPGLLRHADSRARGGRRAQAGALAIPRADPAQGTRGLGDRS